MLYNQKFSKTEMRQTDLILIVNKAQTQKMVVIKQAFD